MIMMKDVIAIAKTNKENKELLVMENIDKTAIAKVSKVLGFINLGISIIRQLTILI